MAKKKTKVCIGCFYPLPLDHFNKSETGLYGLRARCKKCFAIHRKGTAKRMKDKADLFKQGKRKCGSCKKIKSLKNYQERYYASGNHGYDSSCKPCVSIRHQISGRNRNREARELVFNYLLKHPCIDCGETNVLALEFDHVHSKKFDIGNALNNNVMIDLIKAEIKKCVIRCSSCHRIKTHKELNSWRYRLVMERSA
jgi:hypothetical protein